MYGLPPSSLRIKDQKNPKITKKLPHSKTSEWGIDLGWQQICCVKEKG
jgi:hypothetical protein